MTDEEFLAQCPETPAQGQALMRLPEAEQIQRPQITPAQAKVEAIAALTMKAYERAASLELTDEEIAKLSEDFPDEAFKSGAAGKENLLYVEHAYLRDRLNQVFKPGKWAIVPRNRWAEDFRTKPTRDDPDGKPASRVYVEAMLIIRGCFVSEAVGEMEYYPHNSGQNYGDAVEGAKTAALRRCCKELGIGLQAWKKDWCEGWWARKRSGGRPGPAPSAPRAVPTPATAPKASHGSTVTLKQGALNTQPTPPYPYAATRVWAIRQLLAGPGEVGRPTVTEFLRKAAVLMPNEEVESWPFECVPSTMDQLTALKAALGEFEAGLEAKMPFRHSPIDDPKPKAAAKATAADKAKTIEVPRDPDAGDQSTPPTEIDPRWEKVSGKVDFVKIKEGRSGRGPWVSYGVKMGEDWFNTFSKRLGGLAETAHKDGFTVDLYYSADDHGKKVEHIEA